MVHLTINHRSGKARRGILHTPHGDVQTPVFMPVGTAATVKGVTPDHLAATGSTMILANTYHLMLRPGAETVAALGGVHKMLSWDGPMLTDSGGYQVFSLAHLRKMTDEAVTFKSHIDGSKQVLSPEIAVDIQRALGADVMMQLDECPPGDATEDQVREAVVRSAAWAARCKTQWLQGDSDAQALFGIQQGGVFPHLRAESAKRLIDLDLPGYAIGGLSVGEGHDPMVAVLDHLDSQLPADKPRYLMGVGEPRDILAAVLRGVDMFDCVMPTRNGRNAQALTWHGRLRLRNAQWTRSPEPIDAECPCYCCRNYSRGTIRHLFAAKEMLGPTLVSIHNLHFMADFMSAIRRAIETGDLATRADEWLAQMYPAT